MDIEGCLDYSLAWSDIQEKNKRIQFVYNNNPVLWPKLTPSNIPSHYNFKSCCKNKTYCYILILEVCIYNQFGSSWTVSFDIFSHVTLHTSHCFSLVILKSLWFYLSAFENCLLKQKFVEGFLQDLNSCLFSCPHQSYFLLSFFFSTILFLLSTFSFLVVYFVSLSQWLRVVPSTVAIFQN